MVLQVLYVNSGHWACLRLQQGEVFLYDSVYSLASNDTLHIIAQLVQSKEQSLRIQLMNVAKQSGSVDCGLYALAILTSLLLNTDPTIIVFESDEMRPHLVQILQCGKVSMFPIRKQTKSSGTKRFRFTATADCLTGHMTVPRCAVTVAIIGFIMTA